MEPTTSKVYISTADRRLFSAIAAADDDHVAERIWKIYAGEEAADFEKAVVRARGLKKVKRNKEYFVMLSKEHLEAVHRNTVVGETEK